MQEFKVGDQVRRVAGGRQGSVHVGDVSVVVAVDPLGMCRLQADDDRGVNPTIVHGPANLELVARGPTAPEEYFISRLGSFGIQVHAPTYPDGEQPAPVLTTAQSIEKTAQELTLLKDKQKAEKKAAELAAIEAAEKAEAEAVRAALIKRLTYEGRLALATQVLLDSISGIVFNGRVAQLNKTFAEFRVELAPLAATYGFKLVLVGDKTVAVLTR